MEAELECDTERNDELEDDFADGYAEELEESPTNAEEGLENSGEELMADCRGRKYPGRRFYAMYHGTTWRNATKIKAHGFIPSSGGMLGRGVYLSRSYDKARNYVRSSNGQPGAIVKVNVRVGKVKKINYQGHPLQKTWHRRGYDTAWVPPDCGMVPSGLEEDCVYDPGRIKVLTIHQV